MLRLLTFLVSLLLGQQAVAATWQEVLDRARGQTVYWNAWGGSQPTNDLIRWAGDQVEARYGITLEHVKLADTAEAVARVLAEKAAGRSEGGSVDLIWINGENLAAMRRGSLLFGPFTGALPNYTLVDVAGKPTTVVDFTIPVDGFASPWAMAQLVFLHDSAAVLEPPRSIPDLLAWAEAHPGRLAYPQPPDFLGSTFLKQALHELVPDAAVLQRPAPDDAAATLAPLWAYLDRLHPVLWRQGRTFPGTGPEAERLLGDGEIDVTVSFNPLAASAGIAAGTLPETARVFGLERGTIANTSFVAIPFNAKAKEGAMVVADFLLSPEAQARQQDPRFLGSFTVLDLGKLTFEQRAAFEAIPTDPATPAAEALGTPLLEPHPSWMVRVEEAWQRRYASGGR